MADDAAAAKRNEQDLVRRMLAGDERAFDAFFKAFFPRVYRFAYPRLNQDAEAAREVVQATLVKAMRHLGSWRGEAGLFTWICQICRREIADHVRLARRHSDQVVLVEDSEELRAAFEAIAAPEHEQPLRQYSQAEIRRMVQGVLDRLPGNYGDALEWKYVEGLSVDEIGQRLGIGTTAAQSLLARARGAFRDALGAVFGAEAEDILASFG